jgi:cytidylate kinase
MYRAFALKALGAGVSPDSADALVALAGTTSIVVEPGDAGNRVFLDGEEVTSRLRDAAITDGASRVSVHPRIRAWMVTLQQELGAQGGIVMEGRDIGTVVFPNADVKIFLDAEPEVRGLRRYDQLGGPNSKPVVQAEEVVRDLRARDERDRNRADSPLKPAEDSVILDSTELTLEQVLAEAAAIVEKKIKK